MTIQPETSIPESSAQPEVAGRSFIEVQFPVSKLSKESYDERKGAQGQALTGLGKWWGRKPLVLVRAIILGLLLPATGDPAKDRATFLALMTMDDEGLWQRARNTIPLSELYRLSHPSEKSEYFVTDAGRLKWQPGLSAEDRRRVQRRVFLRMSYDRKLEYAKTLEEIDGPSAKSWEKINAHLGTTATSLPDLVQQLGERRFGHRPRVGDAFSGGGSIPFAAARIGCEAYASDLGPVAALLTWGALNIIGGGPDVVQRVETAQAEVYRKMQDQVEVWGIERNEEGWVADAYLYCNEVLEPATGWMVPLAPSWIVAKRAKQVIARLSPDPIHKRLDIEIVEDVSEAELAQAQAEGTWQNGVRCPVDRDGHWLTPSERQTTSPDQLRGRSGLRRWQNDDLVPQVDDVFQERLFCIRWVETIRHPDGKVSIRRHYRAPTARDLEREQKVLRLLRERFADWQALGFIPSRRIEPGKETDRLFRERGWTYWHHLFNPRQLLLAGLLAELSETSNLGTPERAGLLLSTGRVADLNSRLCRWHSGRDQGVQTFYNQALNTIQNYSCRPLQLSQQVICSRQSSLPLQAPTIVKPIDARMVDYESDIWITDPGYADAVNYEEVSEFFLAWYDKRLTALFPSWYADSKRALAVKGKGETFRVALAECYKRLARQMPDNGFQVVMFTHQDPEVWADVALVLWAAGLQVTAAWTIGTETIATGLKEGNYVQGTVILILRKRHGDLRGDMSDLYPDIQAEVQQQLEAMLALDPKDDRNFSDADYQLAAYAAALRVLTSYSAIDEIDVERELRRSQAKNEKSPLVRLIGQAVKLASDVLVPEGLDRATWKRLGPEERLYLKGIAIEAHGETREGVYQELARSYGAGDYRGMLASRTANKARLKTPSEFGGRDLRTLNGGTFAGSLLRQTLFGIYKTATDPERDPRSAREYLRQELPDYWGSRQTMMELLRFLANESANLPHWEGDERAARLLLGSMEADAV